MEVLNPDFFTCLSTVFYCGFHRFIDQFLQDFYIHILELLDIKTSLPGGMFSQTFHQIRKLVKPTHHVECQVLFTWRKTCNKPVAFPPRFVNVMGIAKSDDAGAPHLRL